MGCISKEKCDFCDARCPRYMMDKRLWKELCEEFNRWCSYEEVEDMTYVEGRSYIENMSVWIPMSEANEMYEWIESVIKDMIAEYKTLSHFDTEALRKQGAIQALEELLRRLNE